MPSGKITRNQNEYKGSFLPIRFIKDSHNWYFKQIQNGDGYFLNGRAEYFLQL